MGRKYDKKSNNFFIAFILIFIISVLLKSKTVFNSSNESVSYQKKDYTVDIPAFWKVSEMNDYITTFYSNDKMIGSIEVNPECDYCATTSSIIENFFGMHGYVKGDIIEKNKDDYKIIKVLIGYEKSAAENIMSGTEYPDELHYLYTNENNKLIDLFLDSSQLSEKEMDEISNSLVLKN